MHKLRNNGPGPVFFLQVNHSHLHTQKQRADQDLQVMGLQLENIGRKSTHVVHDNVTREGEH
jgi:hypothetical protein